MVKINLVNAKNVFDKEVKLQKAVVFSTYNLEEAKRRIELMDQKVIHTEKVMIEGIKIAKDLSFNESVKDFMQVALLDHDIGRFAQMRYIGSYIDSDLDKNMGIKNHGILGKMILDSIIEEQLPNMEIFYNPIKTIVQNHVNKRNPSNELEILQTNLLKKYSIDELLSNPCNYSKIVSSMTQIVQDVDRLDIYHQIIDGRLTPKKSDERINSEVLNTFYKGEYLDIALLKKCGLWNANVGELVRLSFVNQIKLLSVAKIIQREKIIEQLKAKRYNPQLLDAFEYTNQILEEMIKSSEDGVIVGKIKLKKLN